MSSQKLTHTRWLALEAVCLCAKVRGWEIFDLTIDPGEVIHHCPEWKEREVAIRTTIVSLDWEVTFSVLLTKHIRLEDGELVPEDWDVVSVQADYKGNQLRPEIRKLAQKSGWYEYLPLWIAASTYQERWLWFRSMSWISEPEFRAAEASYKADDLWDYRGD